MLRHCIMQMQNQSYPTDHVIYVNSPHETTSDYTTVGYEGIVSDLVLNSRSLLKISYGPSKTTHDNHMVALNLVSLFDYDLFLKIDDDDIYLRDYVRTVMYDFELRQWDYSGTVSNGYLNGYRWRPGTRLSSLGLGEEDHRLGIPDVMPPTTAFSRKAVCALHKLKSSGGVVDLQWRRHLARTPGIRMAARSDTNFIYNVHGGNISTGSCLESDA